MTTKTKQSICLTEDIAGWSEPEEKLLKIKERLGQYIGKEVICWGGGGYGGSVVTLDKVEIHPTILKNHDGYTLKAYLSKCEPHLAYDKTDKFDPWLGGWQLSVTDEPVTAKAGQLPLW